MKRQVKFSNYSMLFQKKHDDEWWQWCIFVDDTEKIIADIKQVEYTLHSTFPDPIRTVTDRSSRFALYSSGWGQFTANIEIVFNDNSIARQSHFIKFTEDGWPIKKAPGHFDSPEEEAVYNAIEHEQHRWRKPATIVNSTQLSMDIVLQILTTLEGKELVRKSPFQTIDKSDLWGITAIVGCGPPRPDGLQ